MEIKGKTPMDFTTKPFPFSGRLASSISSTKPTSSKKATFKLSASSSSVNNSLPVSPFTVTALDTTFLDYSPDSSERNITYGYTLLDKLESIKVSLLEGKGDTQSLIDLQHLLSQNHHHSNDPKLKEIIKEIEIRVAVELAKRGLSLSL